MAAGDPSKELPRDPTGRYLHLKLKRFDSIDKLGMKYAKETWRKHPQDAEVELSTNARSSCRWCKKSINKGSLRMRLWLQCHKGCKNSAYFHGDCFWEYPEVLKLESVDELEGWENLPNEEKELVNESFEKMVLENRMVQISKKRPPPVLASSLNEGSNKKNRCSKTEA